MGCAAKKRPVKCGQPGVDIRRESWLCQEDVCGKDTKTPSGWMRRCRGRVETKSFKNERMGAEDPNFEGRLEVVERNRVRTL